MKTNAEKSSSSFFFYSPFPGLAGTAALKIRNGQCRNVRGGILAYLVDRSWRLQASLQEGERERMWFYFSESYQEGRTDILFEARIVWIPTRQCRPMMMA